MLATAILALGQSAALLAVIAKRDPHFRAILRHPFTYHPERGE